MIRGCPWVKGIQTFDAACSLSCVPNERRLCPPPSRRLVPGFLQRTCDAYEPCWPAARVNFWISQNLRPPWASTVRPLDATRPALRPHAGTPSARLEQQRGQASEPPAQSVCARQRTSRPDGPKKSRCGIEQPCSGFQLGRPCR